MAFRVGQKVQQIAPWNDPDTGFPDVRFTECGVVYTIREIPAGFERATLYFCELRNPPHLYRNYPAGPVEQPFPAWNFRPLVERKTEISVFTAMLTPSLEDMRELIREGA